MLTFAAPAWLLGMLLLPSIRWLHRGGRQRRAVPVSRLDLWRGAAVSSPAAGERRPPDPAWRRRALLAALLVVALAEPQWTKPRTDVTLWIDDSLSMLTREGDATRLATALGQVRTLLAELPEASVDVRTLGDPWRSLGTLSNSTLADVVGTLGQTVPHAPPEALLRRDGRHWLVTDGAHEALLEWPGGSGPDRIVRAGSATRNVGLERMSARRTLADPERYDVLLKVANGGAAPETRVVVVGTDAGEVARSTLRLEPGTHAHVTATIPASARVRATLEPGDALAEDDAIVVDLAPLHRLRVATDAGCPPALRDAVDAHPALVPAAGGAASAQAVVVCGTHGAMPGVPGVPAIRVIANRTPSRTVGAVQWSSSVPESHRFRLDAGQLEVAARLDVRPGDVALLTVGDDALIVRRAGTPAAIETALEFGSADARRSAATPLVVNLLFEQLLDRRLLDEIALVDRGAGASRVVPSERAAPPAAAGVPGDARARREWTSPLLVAALLVLAWELLALARQWRQVRIDPEPRAG